MMTRGTLAICIAAFTLITACGGAGDGPPTATSQAELTARTLMMVWESGDVDALSTLFRPDAIYEDFSNQVQYRGIGEIAGYVGHVARWATDLRMDVGAVHASPNGATVEWLLSGVQNRPIPRLLGVATNREFFLNGVTVIELDGDLITRAADYLDASSLLIQLGATITLPDGSEMTLEGVGGPDG
jgi:hypothetical protein